MNLTRLHEFKQVFSGPVILPEDAEYEQVRNTVSDKGTPALVVRPKTNTDITAAIQFATSERIPVSIRSGGHSVAGHSTNTGGMVIDMALFSSVEIIDQQLHLVRVGSGARWIEVATMLEKHGLALSSGDTKSVGVGGLTLGAGIGWMVRKFGLTIDSLNAAEIVTAAGQTLQASETENPDLFWAIRGGGGNFGIVTRFDFIAHPIGSVYAGPITYALDDVGDLLRKWRDYMRTADEALTTIINILPSFFGNPPMLMVSCCYAGNDLVLANNAIDPLKTIGKVVSQDIKEKKYTDVLEDAHPPGEVNIIVRNAFIEHFTDEVIDTIVNAFTLKPDLILQIRGLGGAFGRMAPNATAFAYRSSEVMLLSPAFLPQQATESQIHEALKAWETIAVFGKGSYSGFTDSATPEDLARLYPPETYARLVKVKKRYDPTNFFNQNYNIKP